MRRPRLVLDTNVVLDLYFFEDAALVALRRALDAGTVECLASAATLDEYRRVLAYPAFALPPTRQQALLERYAGRARFTADGTFVRLPRCRDPDDQKFLTLAAAGAADALVSKDRALLKLRRSCARQFRIVDPAQALGWLDRELAGAPRQPASAC